MTTKKPATKKTKRVKAQNGPPSGPVRDMRMIRHEELQPDPINQRRRMDPAKLEDLKSSIKKNRVRMPLEVREIAFVRDAAKITSATYEIVTGHRRYRAVELLIEEMQEQIAAARGDTLRQAREELDEVRWLPCRVLSEEEAKRTKYLQLIENLQREDLSPMDEAAGYQWLIDNEGVSPSDIARETGMTTNHVRRRLKMRNCPAPLIEAMEDGRISAKHCELVGRVPLKPDRQALARAILHPELHDRPLTAEETQHLIETDYMIRLTRKLGCPFDLEDFSLPGGSCLECPNLAKNHPDYQELLADPGRGKRGVEPMVCTAPACYRNRAVVAWERRAQLEMEKGNRVLTPEESARVFSGFEGAMAYDSPYALLGDPPGERDTGHFNKKGLPSWGDLIVARGIELPRVIALHPVTKKRVELVDRQAATDAINAIDGQNSMFASAPRDEDGKKERGRLEREKKKERERFAVAALDAIGTACSQGSWTDQLLLALIAINLQEQRDSLWFFQTWLEVKATGVCSDVNSVVAELVVRKPGREELLAYLMLTILAPTARWLGKSDAHLRCVAEHFRIDLEKIANGEGDSDAETESN